MQMAKAKENKLAGNFKPTNNTMFSVEQTKAPTRDELLGRK